MTLTQRMRLGLTLMFLCQAFGVRMGASNADGQIEGGVTFNNTGWIPSEQFGKTFTFERELWHPRFTKKYIDEIDTIGKPGAFMIVSQDSPGIATYVQIVSPSKLLAPSLAQIRNPKRGLALAQS